MILLVFFLLKETVRKELYSQGLGRHSIRDLHMLMKRDSEALSAYLGELLNKRPKVSQ